MRRLLIVEDRTHRRDQMLSREDLASLEEMPNVTLSESLPDEYTEFDVIAVHRSYMNRNNLTSELISFIKDEKKRLIVFSGGNTRQEIHEEGRMLFLSAGEFYSDKLIPFIQDVSSEDSVLSLAKLVYGIDNWELPILANIRNLEWQICDGVKTDDKEYEIDDLRESLNLEETDDVNSILQERMGL